MTEIDIGAFLSRGPAADSRAEKQTVRRTIAPGEAPPSPGWEPPRWSPAPLDYSAPGGSSGTGYGPGELKGLAVLSKPIGSGISWQAKGARKEGTKRCRGTLRTFDFAAVGARQPTSWPAY